jgi:beta-1,3-glucuronyltransferase
MAGFAVSVEFLLNHPNATMPYNAGYEEDQFLRSLGLTLEDIEPKADSCTQVKYQ